MCNLCVVFRGVCVWVILAFFFASLVLHLHVLVFRPVSGTAGEAFNLIWIEECDLVSVCACVHTPLVKQVNSYSMTISGWNWSVFFRALLCQLFHLLFPLSSSFTFTYFCLCLFTLLPCFSAAVHQYHSVFTCNLLMLLLSYFRSSSLSFFLFSRLWPRERMPKRWQEALSRTGCRQDLISLYRVGFALCRNKTLYLKNDWVQLINKYCWYERTVTWNCLQK